jgi:hypothetical protein
MTHEFGINGMSIGNSWAPDSIQSINIRFRFFALTKLFMMIKKNQ